MLSLATATRPGLYCGAALSGGVYGAYWTLIPIVSADLFGLRHLGANYKAATLGEAAGYLAVGRQLSAGLYERGIASGGGAGGAGGSKTCLGPQCYRYTFLAAAALSATAVAAALALSRRPLSRASVARFVRAGQRAAGSY
jgi:hypothetical protein